MTWNEVRRHYRNKWLLIEALKTHNENNEHFLDGLAVINTFSGSVSAMKEYSKLHKQAPERELYVLHTSREKLDIVERKWLGIRSAGLKELLEWIS
ncbi:MAG: hypothetical protein ACE5IR_13525 [bacterium]